MKKTKNTVRRNSNYEIGEDLQNRSYKNWGNECGDEDYGEDYDYDRKS